ncbi:unnamed protein product [Ambrosiozyma monospora]|uniref:Unnamed protein product n=1 Tax=Ambrosiozyma monospora TaxID=43982 RepID=A0A9W7DBS2_AMBMO|nr:unnamed protein product [Ambrosiozyma monospora]
MPATENQITTFINIAISLPRELRNLILEFSLFQITRFTRCVKRFIPSLLTNGYRPSKIKITVKYTSLMIESPNFPMFFTDAQKLKIFRKLLLNTNKLSVVFPYYRKRKDFDKQKEYFGKIMWLLELSHECSIESASLKDEELLLCMSQKITHLKFLDLDFVPFIVDKLDKFTSLKQVTIKLDTVKITSNSCDNMKALSLRIEKFEIHVPKRLEYNLSSEIFNSMLQHPNITAYFDSVIVQNLSLLNESQVTILKSSIFNRLSFNHILKLGSLLQDVKATTIIFNRPITEDLGINSYTKEVTISFDHDLNSTLVYKINASGFSKLHTFHSNTVLDFYSLRNLPHQLKVLDLNFNPNVCPWTGPLLHHSQQQYSLRLLPVNSTSKYILPLSLDTLILYNLNHMSFFDFSQCSSSLKRMFFVVDKWEYNINQGKESQLIPDFIDEIVFDIRTLNRKKKAKRGQYSMGFTFPNITSPKLKVTMKINFQAILFIENRNSILRSENLPFHLLDDQWYITFKNVPLGLSIVLHPTCNITNLKFKFLCHILAMQLRSLHGTRKYVDKIIHDCSIPSNGSSKGVHKTVTKSSKSILDVSSGLKVYI